MKKWNIVLLGLLLLRVAYAERKVAIILDTSGSMNTNDSPRYTIQLAKILGELVQPGDLLVLYRMPDTENENATPNPSLGIRLDPQNRNSFKDDLERIPFSTGTYLLTPTRTAVQDLGTSRNVPRLLLILTDADTYSCCDAAVDAELRRFQATGATVATVGVGRAADIKRYQGLDIVRLAKNPRELIDAVAEIYQRFLGGRNVQTGNVQGQIQVKIDPFVREAFLVVTADGPMPIPAVAGNQSAASIDTNFRGGGETAEASPSTGRLFDLLRRPIGGGKKRGYRIVRLEKPRMGDWSFDVPNLANPAAWMLIEDFSIGLRLTSTSKVSSRGESPVEIEVVDENTGQRITDPAVLKRLQVTASNGGNTISMKDDGTGGDRSAGDGIFTGSLPFHGTGQQSIHARIAMGNIDRQFDLTVEAVENGGTIHAELPKLAEIGSPVNLKARFEPLNKDAAKPPDKVIVNTPDGPVELTPGVPDADSRTTYAGSWTPRSAGTFNLRFEPQGNTGVNGISASVHVVGRVKWPVLRPIRLGPVHGKETAEGVLDLSGVTLTGEAAVDLSTDVQLRRVDLEIDDGGWKRFSAGTYRLMLTPSSARYWKIRISTGECPAGCSFSEKHTITLSANRPEGTPDIVSVPVSVEVIPGAWLYCYRYVLGAAVLLLLTGFILGGIILPARFPKTLGVQFADSIKIENGVFHSIRRARGSGAGFYRDARMHLTSTYSLSRRVGGSIAEIRARGKTVILRPTGASIQRQALDGTWELIPPNTESRVLRGLLYRTSNGKMYFDFRSK